MAQAKPTLDRKAAEQINLNVLKRLDPQVEELLATAGHVALYDFDVPTRRWARKDVEGSLFLVKRRGTPRFQIIILNKKSADNYVEDVGGGFQCELNPPYLLYRNKVGEVVGIWFYEEADCKRIAEIITKISSTFAAPSDAEAGVGNGTASSQPSSPAYAPTASTQAETTKADYYEAESGVNGGNNSDNDEDDGIFWDKKVDVPAEVNIPGVSSSAASAPAQQAPAGSNALAGLFAGLKVAPSAQAVQAVAQLAAPQQTPAPPAPIPAPQPAAAAGASIPLLTPQFLLNQQQQQAAQAKAQPIASLPAASNNQGALLLQSLRSANASSSSATAQDGAKVATLLRNLADNETFCSELAKEMRTAGMLPC